VTHGWPIALGNKGQDLLRGLPFPAFRSLVVQVAASLSVTGFWPSELYRAIERGGPRHRRINLPLETNTCDVEGPSQKCEPQDNV
jgi:hypothetical protein